MAFKRVPRAGGAIVSRTAPRPCRAERANLCQPALVQPGILSKPLRR